MLQLRIQENFGEPGKKSRNMNSISRLIEIIVFFLILFTNCSTSQMGNRSENDSYGVDLYHLKIINAGNGSNLAFVEERIILRDSLKGLFLYYWPIALHEVETCQLVSDLELGEPNNINRKLRRAFNSSKYMDTKEISTVSSSQRFVKISKFSISGNVEILKGNCIDNFIQNSKMHYAKNGIGCFIGLDKISNTPIMNTETNEILAFVGI